MKLIDLDTWNRKEHFKFFSKMQSPYFGITAEVDCTITYQQAKRTGCSFFATYLHKSMAAINAIPEFKLRIIEGKVYEWDTINAGGTISRADGTFGFIYAIYSEDFDTFNATLRKEIAGVQNCSGLRLNNEDLKTDLIRHSTVPWINFKAILHPTNFDPKESVPKITFGKFREEGSRKYMPVSVEAHHGLMDGLHISQYFSEFQRLLDK